jgi:hypothetical protein
MSRGDITTFNVNWKATIYPNESGWAKIRQILEKQGTADVDGWIRRRASDDGGYTDQLWSIISDLGPMFFNGTGFFESANIKLIHE